MSLATLGVLVAAAAVPGAAYAGGGQPPISDPAIAQYVEPQPTLSGPATPSGGPTATPPKRVVAAVTAKGGSDASALLTLLATGQRTSRQSSEVRRQIQHPSQSWVGPLAASTGLSTGTAILLAALVLGVSAVLAAVAVRRRDPPRLEPR